MTKILKGKLPFSNDLYERILVFNETKEKIFTYHHINILSFLMWKSSDEGGLKCSNISLKDINEFLETKDNRYKIAKKVLEDLHLAGIIILPTDNLRLFIEFPKPSQKMAITLTEYTDSNISRKGFTYIPKALIQTFPKSISTYLAISTIHSKNYNKISYTRLMERAFISNRNYFTNYLNDLIDNDFIVKSGCKGAKKEANSYKVNDNYMEKVDKQLPVKKLKQTDRNVLLEEAQ